MYKRFKTLAKDTGDPARLAKIRQIEREAQVRVADHNVDAVYPIYAEIIQGKKQPIEFIQTQTIWDYGRDRCKQMINRPLPFVIAYVPSEDTGWPF